MTKRDSTLFFLFPDNAYELLPENGKKKKKSKCTWTQKRIKKLGEWVLFDPSEFQFSASG